MAGNGVTDIGRLTRETGMPLALIESILRQHVEQNTDNEGCMLENKKIKRFTQPGFDWVDDDSDDDGDTPGRRHTT